MNETNADSQIGAQSVIENSDVATAGGSFPLKHLGQGAELFAIFIVNLLLRIVTLNIYHFWAITRVRRYLWSQTEVDGERFEYTGTGKELFIDFLKSMLVMLVLGAVVAVLLFLVPPLIALVVPVAYIGFLFLIGVGIYSAAQYQASHTRLRGVRFALVGSAFSYGGKMLGGMLLCGLTLGLYVPYMNNKLYSYQLNNSYYGGTLFRFEGQGSDMFRHWVICWLLLIPTLGLSFIWYSAREARYNAEHTTFPGLTFASTVTGGAMFVHILINMLLLGLTLGLAFPWVVIRNAQFQVRHMVIDGAVDYSAIDQSHIEATGQGEGLSQALDFQAAL